ncbi:MAG: hypothetical protein AAF311_02510 [Pseudomonadota bacterium]
MFRPKPAATQSELLAADAEAGPASRAYGRRVYADRPRRLSRRRRKSRVGVQILSI